jgi:hypothetical protein
MISTANKSRFIASRLVIIPPDATEKEALRLRFPVPQSSVRTEKSSYGVPHRRSR